MERKPLDQMTDAEREAEFAEHVAAGRFIDSSEPLRPMYLREAESIVRAALGLELYDVPAYVLSTEDIPQAWHATDCCGWTHLLADLKYEQAIRELGLWKGRGFCCVIDVPEIKQAASRMGLHWERKVMATAIHEAAHFVADTVGRGIVDPTTRQQKEQKAAELGPETLAFLREMLDPVHVPQDRSAEPLWHQHELSFIRAAIHLWWRVRGSGFGLRDVQVAGHRYGLSDCELYRQALGAELLSDAPLSEILAEPIPDAAAKLFAADTTQ